MSIREGNYTVPAQASAVMRAARQLRSAFDDVFRWVPETERNIPRRSVRKFCDRILAGEQPAPVYYRRETREDPHPKTPDGDKYTYRIHTVDVHITGTWRGFGPTRVLEIAWRMESTYVYHATVDGEDVSGTLQSVWDAQLAAQARELSPVNLSDWHFPSGDVFPAAAEGGH